MARRSPARRHVSTAGHDMQQGGCLRCERMSPLTHLNAARNRYLHTAITISQRMAGAKRKAVQTSQYVRSACPNISAVTCIS